MQTEQRADPYRSPIGFRQKLNSVILVWSLPKISRTRQECWHWLEVFCSGSMQWSVRTILLTRAHPNKYQARRSADTINEIAIRDFVSGVHGSVVRPKDQAYESARRIWNAKFDRRPGRIVRCAVEAATSALSPRFYFVPMPSQMFLRGNWSTMSLRRQPCCALIASTHYLHPMRLHLASRLRSSKMDPRSSYMQFTQETKSQPRPFFVHYKAR
jgi:hypothetical protein